MANSEAKSNGPDWGAITKWIVIGIVLIVLIFVLKAPLSGLVNRATNVEITSSGVKILTVQTDVGDVKYSQEKIKTQDVPKLAEDPNLKTFVNDNQYVLTWPKGTWRINNEMLEEAKNTISMPGSHFDMFCSRMAPSKSGFTPNVNVVVGNADQPINQLMEAYKKMIIPYGANILDEKIDESTQGALLTFNMTLAGRQLYYIQRIEISNGRQYTITATTTIDDDAQTKNELLSILNSFKIIDG